MSTSPRSPRAKNPSWEDTLVSFDLRPTRLARVAHLADEGSGRSAPPSRRSDASSPGTPSSSPGKLVAPHRAPKKSGFYPRVDPYAGLEQLDREELDERDEDVVPSVG